MVNEVRRAVREEFNNSRGNLEWRVSRLEDQMRDIQSQIRFLVELLRGKFHLEEKRRRTSSPAEEVVDELEHCRRVRKGKRCAVENEGNIEEDEERRSESEEDDDEV